MRAWDLLGLEPTQDIRAIKRAYSVKLKTTRPDDDAQAYQQLREAYEWAQHYAKYYAVLGDDVLNEPVAANETPTPQSAVEPPAPTAALDLPALQEAPEPVPVVVGMPGLELLPHVEPAVSAPLVVEPQQVVAPAPTVEGLLKECADLWAWQGSKGMVEQWPRLQALLDDLPITDHNHASRAFAQFVAAESDLPVEVLVALTRHFQWGLDFRVDQMLGAELSGELYQRLSAAEVFAAFRPERFTQHAWALALAKLWDRKRGFLATVLAVGLDYQTRHRVLQARLRTLHVLGVSPTAAKAAQGIVAMGGVVQGVFFSLMVAATLIALHEFGGGKKLFSELVAFGVFAAVFGFLYLYLYTQFNDIDALWRRIRGGRHLDAIALVPALVGVAVFLDQQGVALGGYSSTPAFFTSLVCLYLGLWLVAPTDEQPWRKLVLPTFILLMFGSREFFAESQSPLWISLACSWTLGAHAVLRRYPDQVEVVYAKLIKLGLLRENPLFFLGIKFIAIAWALVAVAMLPVLLFRMAAKYRVLYVSAAIYAGVLLGNAGSQEGQSYGLLAGVLAVVLCIQVFQTCSQRLADYGLKKLSK